MVAKRKKVKKSVTKVSKNVKSSVKKKDTGKMSASVIANKMRMIVSNLIFFIVLFLVCVLLYSVSGAKVYQDLFFMFAMVFGFVGLAFLITLLVFFFLKLMKKA